MGWQQTIIIGNVGRDPEFNYSEQGVARCKFSVAVSKVSGKGEDRKEKTTWYNVTLWRQLAETASQYVKKGKQIMLTGEVEARLYTDKNNQPQISMDFTAREMQLLGSRGDEGGSPEAAGGRGRPGASGSGPDSDDASDLPF